MSLLIPLMIRELPLRELLSFATGDAIRAMYSNVGVGVGHVPCSCAGAEHNVMLLSYRSL